MAAIERRGGVASLMRALAASSTIDRKKNSRQLFSEKKLFTRDILHPRAGLPPPRLSDPPRRDVADSSGDVASFFLATPRFAAPLALRARMVRRESGSGCAEREDRTNLTLTYGRAIVCLEPLALRCGTAVDRTESARERDRCPALGAARVRTRT